MAEFEHLKTPILVVDDTKFSAVMISKNLQKGGFTNMHSVSSAIEALNTQKKKHFPIMIADWLMPQMDGLELTKHIRELDKKYGRHTYIIMITAKEGNDAINEAFSHGVNDFISKGVIQEQLIARVAAAEKMNQQLNLLHKKNHELALKNQQLAKINLQLKELCTLDAATRLGNKQYALRKLEDHLKHTAYRGGACCYILVRFADLPALSKRLPQSIIRQIIQGLGKRLKNLVRPLDDIARVDSFSFAILTHQPTLEHCVGKNFQRIFDSIDNQEIKTSMGFQSINIVMGIAGCDAKLGLASANEMIELAENAVKLSRQTGEISHLHFKGESDESATS